MHAGQPPHVLLHLELREADGALVALLLLLLGALGVCWSLVELVRESVPLNAGPAGSSVHASSSSSCFHQSHIFLERVDIYK